MNVLRKTMQTISSPGTPAAFQTRIYLQSDHRIFWKNTIFDCKSKKERSPYGLLTASCQSSKKKLKILKKVLAYYDEVCYNKRVRNEEQ